MKRLCEALASRTLAVLTVALVLGILFVSLAAEAQEAGKVYRVGILASGTHAPPVFIAGLKGAGLAEGRDIEIGRAHV